MGFPWRHRAIWWRWMTSKINVLDFRNLWVRLPVITNFHSILRKLRWELLKLSPQGKKNRQFSPKPNVVFVSYFRLGWSAEMFFFWKYSPFYKLSQNIRNCITGPQGRYESLILPTKLGLADGKVVLVINNYDAQFDWTPGETEAK